MSAGLQGSTALDLLLGSTILAHHRVQLETALQETRAHTGDPEKWEKMALLAGFIDLCD